ncbi:MAG: DUF938 domain-containing protein [Myxococcales bacterium]|nr:DUF938 domain-containing protein [Myxococcales bacterium]MCB9731377.1 DUF938 domain-containing protein [Deltaproteobacteria bacterium]
MSPDDRRHAPAADRNKAPLLEVLARVFPASGLALEIAAGTGQHAVFFARHLAGRGGDGVLRWQPTDRDEDALASIAAWRDAEPHPALLPPLPLDVTADDWPVDRADAILCVNMIHISPWEATVGLMRGCKRLLAPGAPLVTYGPYAVDGEHTAPSNAAFDASLKSRDPRWGVRDVADVAACAREHGLLLEERVPMPANNFSLVFRRV